MHSSNNANLIGWTTNVDSILNDTIGRPLRQIPLFTTPYHSGTTSSGEMAANLGVAYAPYEAGLQSPWLIYREDRSGISPNRRFSALFPAEGHRNYTHSTRSDNVFGDRTTLDDGSLNYAYRGIDVFAFVIHNATPDASPLGPAAVFYDHRIGLDYDAASHRWQLRNQDGMPMSTNLGFNVVVAPLDSPNAFYQDVGTRSTKHLVLRHALLDNNPCAAVFVTRNNARAHVLNNVPYSVDYLPATAGIPGSIGHWYIRTEGDGAVFPANAGFNIMVQGVQANTCR